MIDCGDVDPELVARLRSICLALPEAYEELAWVGMRWRVRKRTFAHVLPVGSDWPPAYAKASESTGQRIVLTFRAPGDELDALENMGPPFYRARWGRDVMVLVLGPDTDWDEVTELLTESYCVLAPKKLVARVDRRSLT